LPTREWHRVKTRAAISPYERFPWLCNGFSAETLAGVAQSTTAVTHDVDDAFAADGFEAAIRIGVSAFSDAALRHRQRQAAVRVITVAHATADHPATAVEGGPNYQPKA
jgi:hypothetical protein